MEKEIYYNVFAVHRDGEKGYIGSYTSANEAHRVAKECDAPYTIIKIEKSSKPFS